MEAVEWLRPEYQGREGELVHLAEGARLVGVTRAAVSNWAARHSSFPALVLLTGSTERRTKYVVRTEFLAFAQARLNSKSGGDKRTASPHRPRVVIRVEQVEHQQAQVDRLTALEKRQAQQLQSTRRRLRTAQAKIAATRASLDAEINAVQQLTSST
ncbi:hypothetical protein [Streptacidiphilus jiangxiensis]|uniref:Uncharacterized protein n=1 Tax=Streptacidiphilus jiangxiensis TaxID=235985 RepID=A0A1H8B8B3_STRJI|nr:hypothetical protein [Streptacidiphilus jiangxiensis]SEM79140.1 hypothetical protein SAMN05414137_15913 [Streptacidiphilus jiangxiensis]